MIEASRGHFKCTKVNPFLRPPPYPDLVDRSAPERTNPFQSFWILVFCSFLPFWGGVVSSLSILFISRFLSECASASTAAPSFIAGCLLRLLSRRRTQYTVCDLEILFGSFLASSLKVLCISCKFLASSLQVLCKFLAKSLQEFSAGGGKRGES